MSTPIIDVTPNEDINPTGSPSNLRLVFRAVLIIAILIALVQVLGPHWTRVMAWGLIDNDDAMRVLEVRDWLNGQAWFDVSQHRLAPPQGGDMHWSRLADLPLAFLMAPLSALFGQDAGAKYAAFFTPIMLGVIYVIAGARTATSLGGKAAFLPGVILMASAPAALSYFLPGRVDHHGLQMILIILAVWGLFVGTGRAAALSGLAIAIGICVGLEALPLQIVLIGWVAARWGLRGKEVAPQAIGFGLGFGLALALLFALTVPMAKWSLPVNDAVGRGYVVLGLIGGLLLAGAAGKLSDLSLALRLVVLAMVGAVVLSGIVFFPEIIVPPYEKVDPLLTRLWLSNVNETAPLATSKLSQVLSLATFPVVAAICAIFGIVVTKGKDRDLWILAILTILVAAGLAIFWQRRVAGLASAVSGVVTAAVVAHVIDRINWKVALCVGALVNPIVPGLAGSKVASQFEPKDVKYTTGGGQGCYTEASFASLRGAKTGLVVAPIDMGARILLTTNHSALAAPYHRNNVGNLAAYRLFLMPQDEAKTRAASLGATFVAICKRSAEVGILAQQAPKGLMSDLQAGRIPAWLKPLPVPRGSDVIAYEIVAN